jgi:hypothetical protein
MEMEVGGGIQNIVNLLSLLRAVLGHFYSHPRSLTSVNAKKKMYRP